MKITFYSNYMNHHQLDLSKEIINIIGDDYKFVATSEMDQERIDLGYADMNSEHDFIIESYKNKDEYERAIQLSNSSDVVIIGSAPYSFIEQRVKEGKLVFIYSERFFKGGFSKPSNILRWFKYFSKHTLKNRKNVYLLAASAYAPLDYSLVRAYKNKMFNWGYFPPIINYSDLDYEKMIANKESNKILWVGRMLDWKHPEEIIYLAEYLRDNNKSFSIDVVGNGEMYDFLNEEIKTKRLDKYINIVGSVKSEEVRTYMENASIFIFTSDSNEGWGAVLNEAMNSACAVVANDEIGSVPFMIEDKKNGYTYSKGNSKQLQKTVAYLLDNPEQAKQVGEKAYQTVQKLWNARVAAERLVEVSENLLNRNKIYFDKGPLSSSSILK